MQSFFSGKVHPGVPHPYKKTARNNNIISTLTRDLSPDGARRVTAKLVNELRKDEVGKKGDQLDLPSGSQNLHITIGQPAEKPQLSADGLIRLKISTNFSTNQCEAVTQWVRDELGRAYVEPGAREQLIHVKDRLADFFTVKVFVIGKDGEESTTTHHLLYCHEVVPGSGEHRHHHRPRQWPRFSQGIFKFILIFLTKTFIAEKFCLNPKMKIMN